MTRHKKNAPAWQGEGEDQKTQRRNQIVSKFTPTSAEARKYANYRVEIREDIPTPVRFDIGPGGLVYRWVARFARIPSERLFVVRLRAGATDEERRTAHEHLQLMPSGEWARFPDHWSRRRSDDGTIYFCQLRGWPAPDPFAQLELEMMIDLDDLERIRNAEAGAL